MTPSVFERHPRTTLAGVWLVFLLVFVVVAEVGLKRLSGLGRPVLFQAHPAYGYRLQPNQETWRFGGAHFKINNLGLRASGDWDADPKDKILFLGDSVTYGGNHISNRDLFSELAVKGIPGMQPGNAGIPNWGVENVHALVVKEKFLPASVYVTTFIEDDFYRIRAPLALTFDDGFANFAEHAVPVLQRLSFPATVFVVSGHCGRLNDWPGQPVRFGQIVKTEFSGNLALRVGPL